MSYNKIYNLKKKEKVSLTSQMKKMPNYKILYDDLIQDK